jgi:hypothetical protein
MRTKKLRGYSRIFKNIEQWKKDGTLLDLKKLQRYQRNYEKVWVRPFSDLSITGNEIPKPKGKARTLILEGLLAIYTSWEQELQTLNEPYYLAIWLFEPHLENSQVVCAIGDFLTFYDSTFHRPASQKKMPTQNYGALKKELDTFNWIYAFDDDHFTDEDIAFTADEYASKKEYIASKKWYHRKLKQHPRSYTDVYGGTTYYVKKGTVWIGTKN